MTLPLFDRASTTDEGPAEPRVLRVSELNRVVRTFLEDRWKDVWVEGEISDVTRASSGHVYFTLSDGLDPAQLRVVMFRGDASRAKAELVKGAVVRVRGSLSLYEPRGTFQLIGRTAVPAGEGDLQARLDRLRRKLEAEGLLDPARKRHLPRLPRVVGVVTSVTGAALHDIVRVAAGRCPVHLVVADCRVQGAEAPESIVRALTLIQRVVDLDVVIVGRGGGSAEELWSFNEEAVARAIALCRVPIVSAVGHEVDHTIADLVADVRAATPSNAAELVVPSRDALAQEVSAGERRLVRALETRLGRARLRTEQLARRIQDPRAALGGVRRRLGELGGAVHAHGVRLLALRRARLSALQTGLAHGSPRAVLARTRMRHAALHAELLGWPRARLETQGARLSALAARLDGLSPLRVLERGYAVALDARTGRAVTDAAEVTVGVTLRVRLHRGELAARVERALPAGSER